ncbi:MAG: hypothetical protein WD512_08905 [Candidatus Paceibacterota bacterium]
MSAIAFYKYQGRVIVYPSITEDMSIASAISDIHKDEYSNPYYIMTFEGDIERKLYNNKWSYIYQSEDCTNIISPLFSNKTKAKKWAKEHGYLLGVGYYIYHASDHKDSFWK